MAAEPGRIVASSLPPIARLNELPDESFAAALAPLFEGAPDFLARLARGRPYASYEVLLTEARDVADEMPEEAQIELIDSHPRIGAVPSTVSALSYAEQGYDRDSGTAELQARLDRLNEAYERRFGFRFVVFVAGRSRADIVPVLEQRLAGDRDDEKRRALDDVIAIARDRLTRLGQDGEGR
ncbi:MAG TPA: 2-oxo-4-hydroxy-4-carboxy-5-ureidoimidazoline decarboxylase [Candidatus Caenarcaniphilales bacterium]|nr:2-oxo-4-hydroxy-4-carboxy-5-ureidoimidazoline decarboxylase [Candidatus Caenarcaniphilales bacterium]